MLRSDADTNAYNFLMSLGLLHVFLPDIDVLNPPVWSISVEFICYAIFAGMALRFGKHFFIIGSACLAILGGILVYGETLTPIGRGLLGFFIGCLIHLHQEQLRALPLAVLVIGCTMFALVENTFAGLVLVATVGWSSLILLAPRLSFLQAQPVQWLGSRSYAIYLVHLPLFIFFGNLRLMAPEFPVILGVSICFGFTFLVADILYRNLEMPAQNYLRKVAIRPGGASAA
jgi:peptidoglycan/LPS O-acetylase OafA/YrhL